MPIRSAGTSPFTASMDISFHKPDTAILTLQLDSATSCRRTSSSLPGFRSCRSAGTSPFMALARGGRLAPEMMTKNGSDIKPAQAPSAAVQALSFRRQCLHEAEEMFRFAGPEILAPGIEGVRPEYTQMMNDLFRPQQGTGGTCSYEVVRRDGWLVDIAGLSPVSEATISRKPGPLLVWGACRGTRRWPGQRSPRRLRPPQPRRRAIRRPL